ncbi:PEP-CTERM sorting domain-containing protein [Pontiella sulfatireligans]|uniref:PEP-CTERM protein-sorting domain-containing protein n=1 Tax=Pontiella sulfatireligans TaxID=2750658 RepID=A0A6C2UKP3_9BACT|nr:PEP-CTERM sorting domain-containing protein [Pontiella sulfatireligans]VGO20678.1 hypothetical protein SCARR_02744 [Pontiella sulfatireligans]
MYKRAMRWGVVCFMAMAMNGAATTNTFNNGGGDGFWSTPANWIGGLPTASDWAKHTSKGVVLTVDSAAYAADVDVSHNSTATISVVTGGSLTVGDRMDVGNAGTTGTGKLVVDGGAVNVGNTMTFGRFGSRHGIGELNSGSITVGGTSTIGGNNATASGELSISGGNYINTSGIFNVGLSGEGTLNMNGGVLQLQEDTGVVWNALRIGSGSGNGTLNLNGGTILTGGMLMDQNAAGTATLNLLGGTLQVEGAFAAAVGMQDDAQMAFDEGTFIWKGNQVNGFTDLVDGGFVSWENGMDAMLTDNWDASWTNGTSVLYADYNDANAGYTTVWAVAIPEPASLGLIALMGGGMLFIRRLLQI